MLDAQFRELTEQPTVTVRIRQPMAETDMGRLFATYLPLVFDRLGAAGVRPAGAAFGRYHQFNPDAVDVEIGIPVAAPPDGFPSLADAAPGEPGTSSLPGGLVAVVTNVGPYENLRRAYDDLHEWIHAQGRDEGDGPWESYIDDPGDTDSAQLRTEIVWPVR